MPKLFVLLLMLITGNLWGQKNPASPIKIMTYNIWNGFDWGRDTARNNQWIQWVQAQEVDVLALQELCGYTTEKLEQQAAQWGHPYTVLLKTDGYPVGLTSRQPIQLVTRQIDDFWHGMLHCVTYDINFFIVHLSPADCDFRLKEAALIAERVQAIRPEQYIILGDFNAHSPFDEPMLKDNTHLLAKYSRKKPESPYDNLRLGTFDYSVLSVFLGIPAIDVTKDFVAPVDRYTFPSPALIGIWQTAEEVRQNKERIDYILLCPELATSCDDAIIFNQAETATFSDHYPVMIELSHQ